VIFPSGLRVGPESPVLEEPGKLAGPAGKTAGEPGRTAEISGRQVRRPSFAPREHSLK